MTAMTATIYRFRFLLVAPSLNVIALRHNATFLLVFFVLLFIVAGRQALFIIVYCCWSTSVIFCCLPHFRRG